MSKAGIPGPVWESDKEKNGASMRIVSWNCGGGLGTKEKIAYFKALNADVAVVPELRESNIGLLKPDSFVWVTNNFETKAPKGLGILTFNGFQLLELPRDPEMEIFIPVQISKDSFKFNLLAVWNFYWACKQGRFKGPRGLEFAAIEYFSPLFQENCVVAGDWNVGPTLSFARDEHFEIVRRFKEKGLRSLYHEYSKEAQGEESIVTFKHTRGKKHLIDHIYGSEIFLKNMKSFDVHSFVQVVGSDHVPLVLEVEIAIEKKAG